MKGRKSKESRIFMPEMILNILKDAIDKYEGNVDNVTLVRLWLDSIVPDQDFELETSQEDIAVLKERIAAYAKTETNFYTAIEVRTKLDQLYDRLAKRREQKVSS
jgi:hypothetical protein